jgi:murein DD-endopeptidase MepM/ murein hydrolase activator NlpD
VGVSRRVLRTVPYVLAALGLAVGGVGALTAQRTVARSTPSGVVASPSDSPPPAQLEQVRVAPLRARVPAHLLVTSRSPLTGAQERTVVAATGARGAIAVSAGDVRIGRGRTTALGVDVDGFRAWTPRGTAESDPVWQSVARGDGAVAHVVGRAFELPLGGEVLAQSVFPVRLHVGSFTTTGLPGVGLVVNGERAAELGLLPHTGLLLSVPQRDPEATAALARAALPKGVAVSAVRFERVAAARAGWVVPAVGRVSSGFGPRLHPIRKVVLPHDGIDIAAPLGAPVYAMSDGVVLYAGPARGFGTEVVLSHKGGVTTVYGHVSRVLVPSGPVRAGQPIALVGNEGDSTGPHLHAEVRVDDVPVDPLVWLRAHGVRIGSGTGSR